MPPPDEDGDLAPEELVRELARYLERPTAGPPTPAEPVQCTLADFAGPPWPAVVEASESEEPTAATGEVCGLRCSQRRDIGFGVGYRLVFERVRWSGHGHR